MDFRQSTTPDFEARITILTDAEGGRWTPPRNGIRWDFAYPEEDNLEGLYMIWPYFIDSDGRPMSEDQPLVGTYDAYMFVAAREMVEFHKLRISEGTSFNCHEGRRIVATGVVTKPFSQKT